MSSNPLSYLNTIGAKTVAIHGLYAEWKRNGQHFSEYAAELTGTAFLALCVVGVVAFMFSQVSPVPHWLPSVSVRLFFAGLLIGSSGGLVAITPLGKLSGAHLNPAVSLGFWMLGKMHTRDLFGYVGAQMAGGLGGAYAAKYTLGIAARQVNQAALGPHPGIDALVCLVAETFATVVLCYVIFTCVSVPRLTKLTPVAVAISAAVLVCVDGHVSGAGMNPARWIGPAADTGTWSLWWIYSIAPLGAGAVAVSLRHLIHPENWRPHTAKIFHDERFRSIFEHDKMVATPPEHLLTLATVKDDLS